MGDVGASGAKPPSENSTIRGSVGQDVISTPSDTPEKTEAGSPDDAPYDRNKLTFDENGEPNSFPDGGFRAWLVVFGVRTVSRYPNARPTNEHRCPVAFAPRLVS